MRRKKVENSFERTIDVWEGLKLDVKTGSGNINIVRREGKLKISATFQVWARNENDARTIAEMIKEVPPIEIDTGTVKIGNLRRYGIKSGLLGPQVSMNFFIEAPPDASVKTSSGSGNQMINGLKGQVQANAGSGNIEFKDIGGKIVAKAGSGGIKVFHALSTVTATIGSGEVILSEIGGNVSVHAGSGNVVVDSPLSENMKWTFGTGSGNVQILLPLDSLFKLRAQTGSGKIETEFPIPTTSHQHYGKLEGKVGKTPKSQIHIKTGSGNIRIGKRVD